VSFPHYDLVQRAYDELIAEGKIQQRHDQEQVEQDKGLLTRRAMYYVNTERNPAIGILEKTEGNNSLGYSVDLGIQIDGTFWDVATDSNGMAQPVNGGPSYDPALVPRWAKPTAELAQVDTDPGPTPPPDGGSGSNQELEDKIDALTIQMQHQSDQIYHLLTAGFHGNCKMGLDMNYGMFAAPMPPQTLMTTSQKMAETRNKAAHKAAMRKKSAKEKVK
jgi:hypothetical protein